MKVKPRHKGFIRTKANLMLVKPSRLLPFRRNQASLMINIPQQLQVFFELMENGARQEAASSTSKRVKKKSK